MDVPNLDTMPLDELHAFFEAHRRHPGEAERMWAAYARMKASAIEARLAGFISQAELQEGACDVIYRNLPEQYRW